MMTTILVHIVDAFSRHPFSGNPAAVCLLRQPAPEQWMQAVASETNLSETAFLVPDQGTGRERVPTPRDHQAAVPSSGDLEPTFSLRWFTPVAEVELCGHATLASAHVLWETGILAQDEPARFDTLSGLLTATRAGEWIEMDFPATPAEETDIPPGLPEALGLVGRPLFFGATRFDFFLEVGSEATVRGLSPDFKRLRDLGVRGLIVTSRSQGTPDRSDQGYDFVSRFFAPGFGIDEDPVTGSAHCSLGPYWSQKLGKPELVGFQASARGGIVRVKPRGDRVIIAGVAVTTMRGELSAVASNSAFQPTAPEEIGS